MSLVETEAQSSRRHAGGTDAEQRARRYRREADKSRERLVQLIMCEPRVTYRGSDTRAQEHALSLGFDRYDLLSVRVVLKSQPVTLIIVPGRVWYRPQLRNRLFDLKRAMAAAGAKAVLICEGQLRKQPRLHNSTLLWAASKVNVSTSDRMLVELMVAETDGATLNECAGVLADHSDPFGAVLRVVFDRRLNVRRDRPISPYSLITPVHERP